jgi:glycosyltransferase involved in cell wall biosynthesis
MQNNTNVLFLSYNGLLEPILMSQAIPYMVQLAPKGFRFTLLTFEKNKDLERVGTEGIGRIKGDLLSRGIRWEYLVYHKNPPLISTFFDLFFGAARTLGIMRSERIDIVHVRGITPGAIMLLFPRSLKPKVLFDMRGLLAEEYVGGGLMRENSLPFRLIKLAEEKLLKRCDAVTVLTHKHLQLNKGLKYLKDRPIPMDVVPCCVDTGKFNYENAGDDIRRLRSELGLEGAFILMYPGKIGTFYFIKEMLEFYGELIRSIPGSVFMIVTNDDTRIVAEQVKGMGIDESRLKFVRGVQFDDMPRYMRIADAGIFFINPYKKLGSSPIKMGEFLASGVPVFINPGVGDTEELVRENNIGVVVERFEEKDYKDAASRLIAMKGEGEALKLRCRDAAIRYLSLDGGADTYEKIYGILLRPGGKA